MRIYPEQFADHLKTGLKPCYLIFGDEPLLKLEAIDAIRQVARKQGFDERHTFVVEAGLDWNQVYDACQAMSLFSARQIIERELPAKVDKDLAARISEIGKQLHPELLLVLSGGRLKQTQMKAAWFDK
ncbi:DNA polymerase III subunit delta, partial [Arcobacter cryaerophilus gv. occultus]